VIAVYLSGMRAGTVAIMTIGVATVALYGLRAFPVAGGNSFLPRGAVDAPARDREA
jgi:hypothetical protein